MKDAGLLIIGHGSTVNPQSSRPTWRHAREIERRGIFAEVQCAFWKEEPSLRDALFLFCQEDVARVFVVPNLISEGYFTQTVIPRELELTGVTTTRPNGQLWHYCEPVGNHPGVTELLLRRAVEVAPGVRPNETALLIVGHGTSLNDNSAVAAKRQVDKIRRLDRFAEVLNVYMEEPPLVADWAGLTKSPNVVVIPFFISDGLHSYEDIPALLGIATAGDPHTTAERGCRIRDRHLFYGAAIGTAPEFADILVEQVQQFERSQLLAQASPA